MTNIYARQTIPMSPLNRLAGAFVPTKKNSFFLLRTSRDLSARN